MAFKVSLDRVAGVATTIIEFNTCWGNGMYGTLKIPHMKRGMLKERQHLNKVLAYVKTHLPAAHPLALKGWKRLPAGVDTLPGAALRVVRMSECVLSAMSMRGAISR